MLKTVTEIRQSSAGLHMRRSTWQQNLIKILLLREREVAQKDPSATAVASVRSTGATVVGSVNAT